MSFNEALAAALSDMARLIDLLGEDSFKAAAHARVARAIESSAHDFEALAKDRAMLLEVPGIGAKMADKIMEFAASGRIAEHDALREQVPPGLLALLEIPGLGPKTVGAMWRQGGITDVASLERAIADGSIKSLPRMGDKAVEKIKEGLRFAKSVGERLWLGRAHALAEQFLARLRAHDAVDLAEAAGSLRRCRDTVGDIDLLVALKPGREGAAGEVGEEFRTTPGVVHVSAAGDSKSSVRVALADDTGRWQKSAAGGDGYAGPTTQVDLRVVPRACWGAALLYFTGSKEHNIRLRERALARGLTLSEWGLFPHDGGKEPPHARGVKPVAAGTEESVYAALGLPWIPPEVREDQGELGEAHPKDWRLIEVSDIRSELHAHTTASDGMMSIEELALAAKARGFHTIAVTDHSQTQGTANGLKPARLREHIRAVRETKVPGITILAGSEVDILSDGRLDYDDELLAMLDVVVASPHIGLTQDPEHATARLLRAIRHPLVHILGHPTGRLVNRRRGLEPDMAQVVAAAKEHNVALEINAHWMRLDLRDVHVRMATGAGCLLSINCDTHARGDMDNLRFGVGTGRRGWLTPDRCINTWGAMELRAWLRKGR